MGDWNAPTSFSVIIPTFNGAERIGHCLAALRGQVDQSGGEILVVDDGSTDNTAEVVQRYCNVRLIRQANAGPAAARNRGAQEAPGTIILFTDDDCVPVCNWLDQMLEAFGDPEVVGAKGIYRTTQQQLMARFVQIEYEERYRLMAGFPVIDFVDTYSAAFRRDRFLEIGGYDTSFPVACAEDAELSYRMSARGWKLKFAAQAIVHHAHPDSFWGYLRKKYKFAFWRVLAVHKNPHKAVRDSHTPQLMKLQLFFLPALLVAAAFDVTARPRVPSTAVVLALFLATTAPFAWRALRKDFLVGLFSPAILAARSCAQLLGVIAGILYASRKPTAMVTKSPA